MHARRCGFVLLVMLLSSCGNAPVATSALLASSAPRVSTATPTPAVVTHTEVVQYVPTGVPTTQRSGSCWGPSIAAARQSAYRCMADDEILDPCFAGDTAPNTVICKPDPTTADAGIQVNLTAPLPTFTAVPEPEKTPGWLVELSNGTTCMPATGALGTVDNHLITHYCVGGDDAEQSVLLDDLMRGEPWMATHAIILTVNAELQLKRTEVVAVRRVWQ